MENISKIFCFHIIYNCILMLRCEEKEEEEEWQTLCDMVPLEDDEPDAVSLISGPGMIIDHRMTWYAEDDDLLCALYETHGRQWRKIAGIMSSRGTVHRTEDAVRQRHNRIHNDQHVQRVTCKTTTKASRWSASSLSALVWCVQHATVEDKKETLRSTMNGLFMEHKLQGVRNKLKRERMRPTSSIALMEAQLGTEEMETRWSILRPFSRGKGSAGQAVADPQ